MDDTLHAGAARRTINPPLGIGEIGLTATALLLGGTTRIEGTAARIGELTC